MANITKLIILLIILFFSNRVNSAIVIKQFSEDTLVKQQRIFQPVEKTYKKPGFFKRILFKGIHYLTSKKTAPEKKYNWGVASAITSGAGIIFLLITFGSGSLMAIPLMMALLGIIFGIISKSNEGPNKAANIGVITGSVILGAFVLLIFLYLILMGLF